MVARGRRATLLQLETAFELRIRRKGVKDQFLTFDTFKEAEQARLKVRLQENPIKGGLRGRSANGRRQSTRAVQGIDTGWMPAVFRAQASQYVATETDTEEAVDAVAA